MNDSRNQLLQGFFRIGIFIGGGGLLMALFQPRDSAEFVVSICSTAVGGLLLLGVIVAMRLTR